MTEAATMRWEGDRLVLIDQTRLPHDLSWVTCTTAEHVTASIAAMVVRGAPAIGVAAAFGLALAAREAASLPRAEALAAINAAAARLRAARPTAVNLAWALASLCETISRVAGDGGALADAAARAALTLYEEDIAINQAIGSAGLPLIPEGAQVLTHCNAGALATAGHGTALGVLRTAHAAGRKFHVWVDETRPYWQGARLTAWELVTLGIEATLICDNMAGHFMKQGRIDRVIVGADRIATNGDTANKIGTYSLGVLAAVHSIPLYVAAPLSTIDPQCPTGDHIPIEERPPEELTHVRGEPLAAPGIAVANPGFDVTPARYVSGIITEAGVLKPPFEPAIAQALNIRNVKARADHS